MKKPNNQKNFYGSTINGYQYSIKNNNRKNIKNDLLPNLSQFKRQEHSNLLCHELNSKKQQINFIRSRMNVLKDKQWHFEKKKERSLDKINFLQTVRNRVTEDQQKRKKERQIRYMQQSELKNNATNMSEQMKKIRKLSKQQLIKEKKWMAIIERKKQKQDQQYIRFKKQNAISQAQGKVNEVKQMQQKHRRIMNQYQSQRKTIAISNYQRKISSTLNKKKKAQKCLRKLKKNFHQISSTMEQSRTQMMSKLIQLQQFNPEGSHLKKLNLSPKKIFFK